MNIIIKDYIEEKILNEYKPGGFILFNSNISDFNNTKKFIKDIQSINGNNMFIGIDQEGGSVQRLGSNVGFKKIPAASLINDKEDAYLLGKEVGMELFSIGVNMNMAPVMDIWSNPENIVMMNRTYGSDPYEVSEKALSFAKGLKEVKIIPVVKHFPGHGATKQDSHYFLPVINVPMNKIEDEDMYPFSQIISNGADAILVGHLLIPKVTGIYPASLSRKFICKYIRKKFKYNGLIITDDLKMRAIKLFYGAELAVKKAFEAGNDIIVFRFNKEEEKRVLDNIFNLVKSGKIKENRINRSVNRILKVKKKKI